MSPAPIIPSSKHSYNPECSCPACAAAFLERLRTRRVHEYGADDPLGPAKGVINACICMIVIISCLVGAVLIWTQTADARPTKQPEPIPIPAAHAKARAECPVDKPLKCRAALIHALEAVEWQRSENLKLARQMVGKLADWTCIHQGEGSWTANTGNGYHGGLQMDWGFMRTYGRDMLNRHAGQPAEAWTPREQIIVAQRAFVQGRGYAPWPQTSHACGLR